MLKRKFNPKKMIRIYSDNQIEKMLTKHMSVITYACSKYVNDRDDLQLLKSQVLEKIWKSRHLYNPAKSSFKTWIHNVTKNLYIDNYRKKRIRPDSTEIEDYHKSYEIENSVVYNIDYKKQVDDIDTLVREKFSSTDYIIFFLYFFEEYSTVEIGKLIELKEGKVKKTIHEIRKYLIANLENET